MTDNKDTGQTPPVEAGDESVSALLRYRFLIENSGDIITTHRPGDWAFTSVNSALERVSGYKAEELLGVPAYEFFHPDDADAMREKLIPAIYQHGVRTFRYRSRRKDGGYYWLESTHTSVRNDDGELLEIIAITRDISEQVKQEEATRRLAAVIEASFALVLFVDSEHRVTYLNQAGRDSLHSTGLGERPLLSDLLGEEAYQKILERALAPASDSGHWHGGFRLRVPQAPERYLLVDEVIVHPPGEYGDSGPCYSLILRDATEHKLIEKKVRNMQSDLIHTSRLMTLGEMASGLAHEINQPLATILNYAQGATRKLETDSLPKDRLLKVMHTIVRQSRLAAEIVKRLRNLVRKTPYQRSEFSLQQVIREVEQLLGHDLWSHQVTLEMSLPEEDATVLGDRVQIQQVLFNLLRNSMDAYQDRGLEERPVFIRLDSCDNGFRLVLEDRAGGIKPGVKAALFEPYISSKDHGLGLGLSISRSIIEAHGGQIRIDDTQPPVTRFCIILPAVPGKGDR